MTADLPNQDTRLILFDGLCNLCSDAVQFVIRRDPKARFRFASRESAVGRAVLARHGITELPESMLLVHRGKVRMRSAAALAIARGMRLPWPLLAAFWLVPYPLRDLVYNWVANHRYRWFGKRELCWVPTPELRARFLDQGEGP